VPYATQTRTLASARLTLTSEHTLFNLRSASCPVSSRVSLSQPLTGMWAALRQGGCSSSSFPRIVQTFKSPVSRTQGYLASGARFCSTSGPERGADKHSIAIRRLRSPVTWLSAAATLGVLYGAYEIQYRQKAYREKSAGRPDLGGPFELLDTEGNTVRDTDFHGKWVLLYFGFTKCPDICPQEMEKVTTVLNELEAKGQHVQPIFITIDPARDTAERLKSYFAESDYHKKFLPLTGSFEKVKAACRSYRVYFTKPTPEEIKAGDYLIDHSIISYLIAPDGQFLEYYGKSKTAKEMESGMSTLIAGWENEKYWRDLLPKPIANTFLGPPEPPRLPRQEMPKMPTKKQTPAEATPAA